MSIIYNVPKIKPIHSKTFLRRIGFGVEVAKMDIMTYGISYLNIPHKTFNYTKDVLSILFPRLAYHIAQPQYCYKTMYFDIYFENNKKQNYIFSRLEISFVWNGDPNIQTIINNLFNKITHMEETYLLEPIENLNMVIISTKENFLTDFFFFFFFLIF